jgi:hypothetical protein
MPSECGKISDAVSVKTTRPAASLKPRIRQSAHSSGFKSTKSSATLSNDRSALGSSSHIAARVSAFGILISKGGAFSDATEPAITGSRCKPTDPYRRGPLHVFRIALQH